MRVDGVKQHVPFYSDGIHTVKELLIDFNKDYFIKEENLKSENVSADYVPALGEIIEYEWRFNLSKGAKIGNVNDKEKEILMEIVKKIVDVIDVKFVSIDIVRLTNNQYMVMEINSGVMMENLIKLQENGEQIAKALYESAIDLMFN